MNFFWRVNYTPGDIYPWGGAETLQPIIPNFTNVYDANLTLLREGDYYYSNENSNDGDFVNRHANFRNLGASVLTLVRCATGESFNGIMHDLMGPHWGTNMLRCCPTCGPIEMDSFGNDKANTSCGPYYGIPALILMLTYTVIMGFIIVNGLFIGVIVDNFTNIGSDHGGRVTIEAIEEFREIWKQFDPKGTLIVPSHSILAILQNLRKPLGLATKDGVGVGREEQLRVLKSLQIPDHGGNVHYMEVLTALTYRVSGSPAIPLCETTKNMQKMVSKVPGVKTLETPLHDVATNYLAARLQSRWRSYYKRTSSRSAHGGNGDEHPSSACGNKSHNSAVANASYMPAHVAATDVAGGVATTGVAGGDVGVSASREKIRNNQIAPG